MNVAHDALARRNRTRELMANGMSGLVVRNRRIGSRGLPEMSVNCIRAGMFGGTIVSVDYVASAASAGAIIAGLIVGAGKGKQRVHEPGLLQAQKHRIGAEFRAESAGTQLDLGLARIFFQAGVANFRFRFAAALEYP